MTIEEVDERIDMKLGIFMEHIDDKFEQILEAMGVMIDQRVRLTVQEELIGVKQDINTIKHAVKETNQDVQDLKQRMTRVEKVITERL
jgi:septal ring factor EnvC (AmiA/AmiB activator)